MAELTRAALREIEALWETGGSPFGSGAGEAVRALLDEVYRQRTDLDQARAERDAANAQCAKAVRERDDMRVGAVHGRAWLTKAVEDRSRLRAALDVAERWLRTLAANPSTGCPHAVWVGEAQGDIAAALAQPVTPAPEPACEHVGERDRARNTAAALEAENAELLAGLRRLRKTACDGCDAAEVADNVLASVDPLRDEPEAADHG